MNDELQSQLAQILNQITTSISEAKDFSVSQLPDIAQQYITGSFILGYHFCSSLSSSIEVFFESL